MPAINNLPIGSPVRTAKSTIAMDGGISPANVPAAATQPADTPGLYPYRIISGKAMRVKMLAATVVEPDIAANMACAITVAIIRLPRTPLVNWNAALYKSEIIPAREAKVPIRTNNGTTTKL